MRSNRSGNFRRALLLVGLTVLGSNANLRADDTEIYQTEYDAALTGRPKVLIAIDDSGSMTTVIPGQRPAYDPAATYDSKHDNTRIYWSTATDGSLPSERSNNYFNADKNRCAESYTPLTGQGYFQTKARRWIDTTTREVCTTACPATHPFVRGGWCHRTSSSGSARVRPVSTCVTEVATPGSWTSLSSSAHTPRHVECQVDVTNSNPSNGSGASDGYAKNNVIDSLALSTATPTDAGIPPWGSETYTFYTAHYMDWYYDDALIVDRTRMEIARDVITSLIAANTGIDFGLMEFNGNWSSGAASNGGRIVQRIIKDMTALQRTNAVDLVNAMNAEGSTPICESMFEAYKYLAGDAVLYGTQDDGPFRTGDELPRDLLAESPGGTYASPASDCAYTYVVLMTDGEPQNDTNANAAIETLTGKTCINYPVYPSGTAKNCLPEITEYMANTDLDKDTTNGNQYGITYTIGFTTDQELLKKAAKNGKGQYFTADNAAELTAAFRGAILSILSTDSTFTSPSVAVDTFSRTQSRDDVFYAMFKPNDRIDWRGNIKKLKVVIDAGAVVLVDANGDPAQDSVTNFIKDTATTFWSASVDGSSVEKGGVGQLLAERDPSTRTIYSNTGTAGALQPFNKTNMVYSAFDFDDAAQLFAYFGVSSQAQLDILLSWARGFDEYDEDGNGTTAETRPWILADILHSQPLVVNYGALGSFTKANPDLRLMVGTNAGFVHMFGNDNGQEDWAFFPKELAPVLQQRALNPVSSQHVYGVDNTPVLYVKDVDRDGTIDADDDDKAYVYLTLQRGGDALYALDVSDPDSPAFMWMIDSGTSGFGELGQTWSRPIVTTIPGYADSEDKPKPVLIFGAGYDTNKDASGVATPDDKGRGIYIVDAETGALVWGITPAADSVTNKHILSDPGEDDDLNLLHSVAAGVMPLDSNGDVLTDRIYFADTGGNLWRVDLPGNSLPTAAQNTWHITKMAAMNGGTVLTDRRFFNAPDVVRTSYGDLTFDAIAIGSGDRSNPNATDGLDQFYMIRDQQVSPYFTEFNRATACDADEETIDDFRCQLPLGVSNLYDITDDLIHKGADEATRLAAAVDLQEANGWRMDLEASGEKSLAKSLTLSGILYFTTFSPEVDSLELCVPSPGTGRLYAVDLLNGKRDEPYIVPGLILDTPSPYYPPDDPDPDPDDPVPTVTFFIPGLPPLPTGVSLPDPYGAWWYREEY